MILVDTSIWVDFFQLPEGQAASTLSSLIKDHNQVATCGIVLQEILQGIREPKTHDLTRDRLLKFPFVDTNREIWLQAASLYCKLRASGITLPPLDVTIAAIAIQNNMPLFTRDNHFDVIAKHSSLKLF